MKIDKYKYLGNGRYKIFIENNEYIIYEDIILKYSILTKDLISKEEIELYLKDNSYYEAYYMGISYIEKKLRTSKELFEYLKKSNFSDGIINDVIERLTREGYLNQSVYASSYIREQINLKNVGPYKIEKDLINLGIDKSIIDECIVVYTDDIQKEKIIKLIDKEIRLNRNKSFLVLKNKILINLVSKGFDRAIVYSLLENIDIDDSHIYDKEYKKLYDKLSKKYSGSELEYNIKEKLFQKGFREK